MRIWLMQIMAVDYFILGNEKIMLYKLKQLGYYLLKPFIGDSGTKNLVTREKWIQEALAEIPKGLTILFSK